MGGFVLILLILMFFIGIINVLTALVVVVVTRNELVRKHMLFYLAGVAGYFAALAAMGHLAHHDQTYGVLPVTFFFAGALSLFFYHMAIITRPYHLG